MSTASSTLWGNIISSVGVFVVTAGLLGTWVNQRVSPIEARIDAIDRRLDDMQQKMIPIVTLEAQRKGDLDMMDIMRKELSYKINSELFDTFRDTMLKEMETDKVNTLRVIDEVNHQIHSLEEKFVPRAENTEHWTSLATAMEDINKRLDYLNARINTLISPTSPAAPSPPGAR